MSDVESLYWAAERYYQFNDRVYHDHEHAFTVAENVNLLLEGKATQQLVLAAWWHDAVYFPGARNGVNELASAAALTNEWITAKITAPLFILHEATRLIEHTTIADHLTDQQHGNTDLGYLLDSDLSSLASDYDTFVGTQRKILYENHLDGSTKQSLMRSANFLTTFLSCGRPTIYHTTKGKELWEDAARANITRLVEETK